MSKVRKIFVDFEFNSVSKDFMTTKPVTKYEIVEFGAVMVDEQGNEIKSFQRYVKPMHSDKVSKFLIKNSGITEELLSDKDDFETVLNEFLDWCGACDYEVYAWSDSDLDQMRKELELKGVEANDLINYLLDNWYDLQFEYDSILGFRKQQSLANALYMAGIEFEGEAHHAYDDARNTAKLHRFLNDPVEKETTIKNIQEALNPKADVVTLGDLIDWSAILSQCSFAD